MERDYHGRWNKGTPHGQPTDGCLAPPSVLQRLHAGGHPEGDCHQDCRIYSFILECLGGVYRRQIHALVILQASTQALVSSVLSNQIVQICDNMFEFRNKAALVVISQSKIVIIAQEWPYWLAPALAMKLLLAAVFITKEMQSIFSAQDYIALSSINDLWEVPPDWSMHTVLALGMHEWLNFISTKLRCHEGPFIYATDTVFKGQHPQDLHCLLNTWIDLHHRQGLALCVVWHANFGGVTSGFHLVSSQGVDMTALCPPPALPQILGHILKAMTPDPSSKIEPPSPIDELIPSSPIVRDRRLCQEGLVHVFQPSLNVPCPCVFKATGWAQCPLSAKEILHAFDMPLNMDEILLTERRAWGVLQCSITPIVVLAIFCLLWSGHGGGETGSEVPQQRLTANKETEEEMEEEWRDNIPSDEIMMDEVDVPEDEIRMDETRGQDVMEEHYEVVEEAHRWPNGCPQLTNGPLRT
jgi:hypothetical protein